MHRRPFTTVSIALAIPAVLAAGLMLTGCGDTSGGTAPTEPTATSAAPDSTASPGDSSSTADESPQTTPSHPDLREFVPDIAPQEAADAALHAAPGDLQSIELTPRRSGLVYRVEIITATEEVDVDVDAADGSVLGQRPERIEHDEVPDPAISLSDVVPVAEAMVSATAEIDEPVGSWKLGFSDGRLVYQFEFASTDREAVVDAFTGQLFDIDD